MNHHLEVLEFVDCPVCGCADHVSARLLVPRDQLAEQLGIDGGRSHWVVCQRCAMVFQSPRPRQSIVDALYLEGNYHRDRGGVPEHYVQYSLRRSTGALSWCLAKMASPPLRAFDIGCGVGGALVNLRGRGIEVFGAEPDPVLSDVARNRFGLQVQTGYVERLENLPDVDLVYSCHVWEHLQNPLETARVSHRLLRERNGHICIVVPTFRRSRTRAWQCFNSNHTNMFTHISLANVLHQVGFETVAYRYFADADSELWLLARAVDAVPDHRLDCEKMNRVQIEIMTANLKAPLGLPRRLKKHLQTFADSPTDFFQRAKRAISRRTGR